MAATNPARNRSLLSTKRLIFLSVLVSLFTLFTSWSILKHLFDSKKNTSIDSSDAPQAEHHQTVPGTNSSKSFTGDNAPPILPHNSKHSIVANNGIECDAAGDCRGFFHYSGPNRSPNATRILNETADAYRYGSEENKDGHLIFFPKKTKSAECITDWIAAKFASRGMSLHGEDRIIFNRFFRDPAYVSSNHFYMEIGAHDGVRESNSRLFDLCLGWEGLLVEPHPGNYDRMRKLRPTAHHLGVAPSCDASDVVMFPMHRLTNAVANQTGAPLEVHCGPLAYYLEQLGIRRIDFFSLDVEGNELNVLKTIDFDKVQIDVILVESENRLEGKADMAEEVRAFLGQRGYLILASVTVFHSDVFLHKRVCHRYDFSECTTSL